ncbi:hypothetical protein GCM10023186_01650 [Hymenobacter koreensis]|uniref:Uncharacterized protein n=2 Tax=Hymenobacter koreensis TaxID=1084523 RepID=A0ABP8ITU6_9BACT
MNGNEWVTQRMYARGEGSYVLSNGRRGQGTLSITPSKLWVEPHNGSAEIRFHLTEVQRVVIVRDTFEVVSGNDLATGRRLAQQPVRVLYSRHGYLLYQLQGDRLTLPFGIQPSRLLLRLPDGRVGNLPLGVKPLQKFLRPLLGQCPEVEARMESRKFDLREIPLVLHEYIEWQQRSEASR